MMTQTQARNLMLEGFQPSQSSPASQTLAGGTSTTSTCTPADYPVDLEDVNGVAEVYRRYAEGSYSSMDPLLLETNPVVKKTIRVGSEERSLDVEVVDWSDPSMSVDGLGGCSSCFSLFLRHVLHLFRCFPDSFPTPSTDGSSTSELVPSSMQIFLASYLPVRLMYTVLKPSDYIRRTGR